MASAMIRRFTRNKSSWSLKIGGMLSIFFLGITLLSFFWIPHPVDDLDISRRLLSPCLENWLGTDQFGRDTFSMLLMGARNSVMVAVFSIMIGIIFGVPLGLAATSRKGWFDEFIMRFNDLLFAFPAILSAVMIAAVLGPGAKTSIIAIGVFNIPVFARLTRGAALSIWEREFILAARMAGKSTIRVSAEHVLPNIFNTLIVQATIQFALGILAEAGLSYLGLGTQPPTPSWGKMLNEAQTYMHIAPQLAIYPGIAIVLTVMGLNLFGDGLRDILDPKTGGRA